MIQEKIFKNDVIINPEIIERSDLQSRKEGCMSYPFRGMKKLKRYNVIKVSYQIKGLCDLKTIEEIVEGLKAEIFQHEIDHSNSIFIYDL